MQRAATARSELTYPGVKLSNLDKVMYPAGPLTKAGVIAYYRDIAPVILPHLKNRPVTLKRFPDGVDGKSFYEKNAPSFTPEWVCTTPVARQETSEPPIDYILANDQRTLVWLANLACLELHPFLHRAPRLDRPTQVVFDLDPGPGVDVLGCAEVGFLLRELLAPLGLEIFPKVSGSKGVQIYLPLNTPVTYDATQPFARAVAELLARRHPDRVVSQMAKRLRGGKIFIDWSQNAIHKTTASVYSLRAKSPEPYVSLPVTWDELKRALKTTRTQSLYWEADAALRRVARLGDLFAPVLSLKQKLPREFLRHAI